MPRRQNHSGFNWATVVQIGAIPIITGVFILSGFYYVTGNTLTRHDQQLQLLQASQAKDKEDESKQREKVRAEYMAYQQKNTEILSKLDTRLAVSETKQETANQTLAKIADELTKISAATSRR